MARGQTGIEHLLRRAGFGASQQELAAYGGMSVFGLTDHLLDYQNQPDDVDSKIGTSGYAAINAGRDGFRPNLVIDHARQRWLFRMIHTERPLQEKMALFWHNHFATAYSKIAGLVGQAQATRMLALTEGELPGPRGQLELFRSMALGNFRDLLVEVAKDPAMLFWLDGRLNTRERPQENFGREIMELFTFGIGNYNELDVYAAAKVFTGWNLRRVRGSSDETTYYEFFFNANQHDTSAKTFTFPIYANGNRTIPARAASAGMQDGVDLITALAMHPATARRLTLKLWNFLVSETDQPSESSLNRASQAYLNSGAEIKPLVEHLLLSREFLSPLSWYTRYAWPVEFGVRAVKEIGWVGFSVDALRAALSPMGQLLFEPPDVNGWELGQGWFTTGGMLARMNFASTLAANQRLNLARDAASARSSPQAMVEYFLNRLSPAPYASGPRQELNAYLEASGAWTGSEAQVRTKAAGLARLIAGSAEYQLV